MAIQEMDEHQLFIFSDFIRETTGLTFDKSNWYGLRVSLLERMSARSIDLPSEYLRQIKDDLKEREELVALLIVSETYFFRDRRQFEVLKEYIIPQIIDRKKSSAIQARPRIKIASCGCSYGAEPYSIAIALDQGGFFEEADIEIVACDINRRSIEFAQQAIYNDHYFREPETDISAYFDIHDRKFSLKGHIKDKVRFYCANLIDLSHSDFDLQGTDVIFFRNVLIYFNEDTILKTIRVFEKKLDKNGYLFLGPSESLLRRETSFVFDEIGHVLTWRLKDHSIFLPNSSVRPIRQSPVALQEDISLTKIEKLFEMPLQQDAQIHFSRTAPVVDQKIKKDESHYENAVGYHQIKHIEKSEKEFQEQLKMTPDHVLSMVGLAFLYADSGRDVLAFDYCQRILRTDNLIADAYFIQGLILFRNKDFKEALKLFKKTIYCNEKHFVAQYFLALTYKEFHQMQEANRQFRVAIHAIDDLGQAGLTKELAGHCGNYILSLCIDNIT